MRVIYIAGYGRSRSTLVERLMVQHGGNATVSSGELAAIDTRLNNEFRCQCGQLVASCEVWGEVVGSVSGNVISWSGLSYFSRSLKIDIVRQANEFARALETLGYETLLDSSKTALPQVFRPKLWRLAGQDVRAVLAVRPLSGVLASRIAKSLRDGRSQSVTARLLLAVETVVSWHVANIVACMYRPIVLCTDDLVDETKAAKTLDSVLEILGLRGGVGAEHMIAGNRMRHEQLAVSMETHVSLRPMDRFFASFGIPLYSLLARNRVR